MTGLEFTADDIVVGVEIPGVYDGTCCWLLRDGRIINRMAAWGGRRESATAAWIAEHGDALRAEWLGAA
jgi:hypothetical protein